MARAVEIAGRLSGARRFMLLQHRPGHFFGTRDGGWTEPTRSPHSWSQAGRAMMELGLIRFHPDQRDSRTALTQLGEQVRGHLQTTAGVSDHKEM